MNEIWERAVETALEGETDLVSARNLNLDGAVKCLQGRLPPPVLFEKFHHLEHLSIANIGLSSLEHFPRLSNLQKLILSDNRISGGLEFLVEAGLESLRDLDLSNNRLQYIEDLSPLAHLRLVSLDLYECPVTRLKDYRAGVFELINSLKYLDKMDAEGNEWPESDDEEEEEEEEEDDPGSGEVDGEDQSYRLTNGHSSIPEDGIVDLNDEEGSDADEEETGTPIVRENGVQHQPNGFQVAAPGEVGYEEYEDDGEEDNESGEEIDDEDVVEVHDIGDSDDDEEDEDEELEEVDDEECNLARPVRSARMMRVEGEIDGHEQGEEEDDEDNDGDTGEEEQGIEEQEEDVEDYEDEDDEEDDHGSGYLVQPVGQIVNTAEESSEMEAGNQEVDLDEELVDEDDDVDDLGEVQVMQHPSSSSSQPKRKRDDGGVVDDSDNEDPDDDG